MKRCLSLFVIALCATSLEAQVSSRFSFEASPDFMYPLLESGNRYDFGAGGSLRASFALGAGFSVTAAGNYDVVLNPADADLTLLGGGAGASYRFFPLDRLGVGLTAEGGPYIAS